MPEYLSGCFPSVIVLMYSLFITLQDKQCNVNQVHFLGLARVFVTVEPSNVGKPAKKVWITDWR